MEPPEVLRFCVESSKSRKGFTDKWVDLLSEVAGLYFCFYSEIIVDKKACKSIVLLYCFNKDKDEILV